MARERQKCQVCVFAFIRFFRHLACHRNSSSVSIFFFFPFSPSFPSASRFVSYFFFIYLLSFSGPVSRGRSTTLTTFNFVFSLPFFLHLPPPFSLLFGSSSFSGLFTRPSIHPEVNVKCSSCQNSSNPNQISFGIHFFELNPKSTSDHVLPLVKLKFDLCWQQKTKNIIKPNSKRHHVYWYFFN